MTAANIVDTDPRIVPLNRSDPGGLRELLRQQKEEWLSLLSWDFTEPSRLILEVAERRELSGFAAVQEGRTVGFSYYVVEANRCSIGDVYVAPNRRGRGLDARLVSAVLDEILSSTGVSRIESQSVNIGIDAAVEVFRSRKFVHLVRAYMNLTQSGDETADTGPSEGIAGLSIRAWRNTDFSASARVINQSYIGNQDAIINSQYQSVDGCEDLLVALTDSGWCGEFLPEASRVVIDAQTGRHVGALIASRISDRAGHLSQISVIPAYQGRGIGRAMITSALAELRLFDIGRVTLAVTTSNTRAYNLYSSCGFTTALEFPVFCWETNY